MPRGRGVANSIAAQKTDCLRGSSQIAHSSSRKGVRSAGACAETLDNVKWSAQCILTNTTSSQRHTSRSRSRIQLYYGAHTLPQGSACRAHIGLFRSHTPLNGVSEPYLKKISSPLRMARVATRMGCPGRSTHTWGLTVQLPTRVTNLSSELYGFKPRGSLAMQAAPCFHSGAPARG